MANSPFFYEIMHYKWPFSKVMLNYQRVSFESWDHVLDKNLVSNSMNRIFTVKHARSGFISMFFSVQEENLNLNSNEAAFIGYE